AVRAASAALRVSASPSRPKSRPWLFAIVAMSTPAAASASSAAGGAWNVYRLGSGVPEVPMEVSRLTTVRSAADRCGAIGASAAAGSSSRSRRGPSKWMSPANAMVMGAGAGARGDVDGLVLLGGRADSEPDGLVPEPGLVAVVVLVAGLVGDEGS